MPATSAIVHEGKISLYARRSSTSLRSQGTYDEVVEAWRTSCPRLAAWDEANSGGIMTIVEVADRSAITATSLGRYCWNDVGKMPDSWLPE